MGHAELMTECSEKSYKSRMSQGTAGSVTVVQNVYSSDILNRNVYTNMQNNFTKCDYLSIII